MAAMNGTMSWEEMRYEEQANVKARVWRELEAVATAVD